MSDKKQIDQRMLVTPIFTAYFCDLKEPNKMSHKYRVVAVFESGADLTKMREAVKAAAVSKWGKDIPKNLKLPLKKPEDEKTPELYPAGSIHCALSTSQTPIVYDRSGKTIVGPDKVYPGCKCRAVVHCWPYDAISKDGQPGVMVGLDTLQFVDDGQRLGGGATAAHNMLAANPLPADAGLGAVDDWNFSREPGDEETPF